MSPRTGRPPKAAQPRNKSLNIRLTEKELKDIENCSKALNQSRTDTIMYGIELVKKEIAK